MDNRDYKYTKKMNKLILKSRKHTYLVSAIFRMKLNEFDLQDKRIPLYFHHINHYFV